MLENYNNACQLLLSKNLQESELRWLEKAIFDIKEQKTARKFYLNYSLCSTKIVAVPLADFSGIPPQLKEYLEQKEAGTVEISRIFMLISILDEEGGFVEAVKNLIQIADKTELETFLKYLAFLPEPQNYRFAAVEALRTNISTVFEAISKYNPYPSLYFNDQQWNQMYLKAAFMQLDLSTIVAIDKRANKDLAKIISDYAHERWAASRAIDPLFWRPVSNFLEGGLVVDIKKLFNSDNPRENKVAALVCYNSSLPIGKELLGIHEDLTALIESGQLTWETV